MRAVEGPLASVRSSRPETLEYEGLAEPLQYVWVALRSTIRSVLEEVTIADLVTGELPKHISRLTEDPTPGSRSRRSARLIAHFLRHGESVSNAEPGRDLPDERGDRLTERGRAQAAAGRAHLGELGIDRLWSSPLRRARETAAPIAAELGLEVEIHDDLRELREADGHGELAGEEQRLRRWSAWMAEHPDEPDFAPPGGESFAAMLDRVERAQARAAARARDQRVLAVSHGILLRFFFVHTLLERDFGPGAGAADVAAADAQLRAERLSAPPPRRRGRLPEPGRVALPHLDGAAVGSAAERRPMGRLGRRDLVRVVDLGPRRRRHAARAAAGRRARSIHSSSRPRKLARATAALAGSPTTLRPSFGSKTRS